MLQYIIHRLFRRRHFWRYATFDEVAELYASRLMRIFALRLVSVFTSIYMLQLGYSLLIITLFWLGFYALKVVFSWPGALMIARFGPKHATFISNIVAAISMLFLPFSEHPVYGIWALCLWGIIHAYSGSMNDLAYLVDFSKVKSVDHAGKELGFMNIIEKVATGLSPFIGGAIAFLIGPESIMVISAVLFLLSALPLFATAEPIRTHTPLNFRKFPWRKTWRSMVSQAAVGIDIHTTTTVWTIFLTLVVFGMGSNRIYAEIGLVTSITLFVSILISYIFGQLIDSRHGGQLLRLGALSNSLIHIVRIFIRTPLEAIFTNVGNEVATTAYNMPFLRGMFDTADFSNRRVEYMFFMQIAINVGGMIANVVFALLLVSFDATSSMKTYFALAAVATLFIAIPRFALYKK